MIGQDLRREDEHLCEWAFRVGFLIDVKSVQGIWDASLEQSWNLELGSQNFSKLESSFAGIWFKYQVA
jgi:hypothetical protein